LHPVLTAMKSTHVAVALVLLHVGALSYSHQDNPVVGFLGSSPDGGIIDHPEGLPVHKGDAEHKSAAAAQLTDKETVGEKGHKAEEAPAHHEEHAEHSEKHAEHAEHAEHGESGTTEHGEHDHLSAKEEPAEAESFALAVFLMGGTSSIMFVFYLVNNSHEGIKATTWRVMNMTVSIFVAVLMYGTIKLFLLEFMASTKLGSMWSGSLASLELTLFFVFYLGTHGLLFKLKEGDKARLVAFGTVAGHMTGFAAMYGFADTAEHAMIEELEAQGIVLIIVGSALIMGVLALVMGKVMDKISNADGIMDEDEIEWIDTCNETDDDVFCLAISFLIVLLIRFLIRGKAMPYEPGKVGDVTQSDANILLAVGFGFIALVGAGTAYISKRLATPRHGSANIRALEKRATSLVQHLISMCMAWTFLFWAEWQLYVWGWESTIIGGALVVAVFSSCSGFTCVYLLNYLEERLQGKMARKALKSMELAVGVCVGFSWERAFDVGFEEIEHSLEHRYNMHFQPIVYVAGLSLVLLAIVAPAWRLYILPKTMSYDKD